MKIMIRVPTSEIVGLSAGWAQNVHSTVYSGEAAIREDVGQPTYPIHPQLVTMTSTDEAVLIEIDVPSYAENEAIKVMEAERGNGMELVGGGWRTPLKASWITVES